jgi:hypothetical protein
MAQKIKVQDGIVVYSTPDYDPITPATDTNFGIKGNLDVSRSVSIGNNPLADGTIYTDPGTDLIIAPGKDISLQTASGSIVLNNVVWPDGTVPPVPGMYLGVTALNTLQFLVLPPGGSSTPSYQIFSAAVLQTVFNTSLPTIANGGGLAHLQVFVNGIKQIEGASKNYQVTGATQITFNTGLNLNDNVEIYAYS